MLSNNCSRVLLSFAVLLAVAPATHADLIHPSVMGDTVWFTDIREGSPSNDPLPLYDEPDAQGDELVFPTTGSFAATSEAGNGPDQTDGKLSFMVTAKPGNQLLGLVFNESGLTTLNGPFGGDAFTSVQGFAVVDINEIAGEPVNLPSITTFFSFTPQREFQLSVDGTGPSFSSEWRGEGAVRFREEVTKVTVTLNNILFAATTSDDGVGALIDKKEFSVRVPTDELSTIPEPTTVVLGCACGMLALVVPAKRRV